MSAVIGACFCLAGFVAADLLAAAWVAAVVRALREPARRWPPSLRRRFCAAARLLPFLAGALFAALVVGAGHLRLEPSGAREAAGPLLAAVAVFALVLLVRAPLRALRSWRATRRIESAWLAAADPVTVPGFAFPVWAVRGTSVGLWLSGLLRPRLIAGADVLRLLTPVERAAALEHEHAHASSRDNLWRLLLTAWPGTLSLTRLGRWLEQEWSAASEAAADVRAVRGDAATAVELASALVKVARLAAPMRALGASALGTGDVALRVQSLLEAEPRGRSALAAGALAWAAMAAPLAAIASLSLHAGFVGLVHAMAELLVRRF